jgi:hypothetical protein
MAKPLLDLRGDTVLDRCIAYLRARAGDNPNDLTAVAAATSVLLVGICSAVGIDPIACVQSVIDADKKKGGG